MPELWTLTIAYRDTSLVDVDHGVPAGELLGALASELSAPPTNLLTITITPEES